MAALSDRFTDIQSDYEPQAGWHAGPMSAWPNDPTLPVHLVGTWTYSFHVFPAASFGQSDSETSSACHHGYKRALSVTAYPTANQQPLPRVHRATRSF